MINEVFLVFDVLRVAFGGRKFLGIFMLSLFLAFSAKIIPLIAPVYLKRMVDLCGQDAGSYVFPIFLLYGPVRMLSALIRGLVQIVISGPIARVFAIASHSYFSDVVFNFKPGSNLTPSQVGAALQQGLDAFSGTVYIFFFLLLPDFVSMVGAFYLTAVFLGRRYICVLVVFLLAYLFLIKVNYGGVMLSKKRFNRRHLSFSRSLEEVFSVREFVLLNRGWNKELFRFANEVESRAEEETTFFQRLGFIEFSQATLIALFVSILLFLALVDYRAGVFQTSDFFILSCSINRFILPVLDVTRSVRNLLKHFSFLGNWVRIIDEKNLVENSESMFCQSCGDEQVDEVRNFGSLLEVKDLSVFKKHFKILENISQTFPKSGLIVLTGKNGSGKTTLIRSLVGLQPPTVGTVMLGGQDVSELSWAARSQMYGFVEQDPKLICQTVFYNIFYDINPECEIVKKKLEDLREFLSDDVFCKVDFWVGEGGRFLSKGNIAKIRITQAILKNPKIFLFDEPMANLDEASSKFLVEIIARLKENSLFIVATHDRDLISKADVVLNLDV